LDWGAGKGLLGEFIRSYTGERITWTNYDPGMPEYDQIPDGPFDIVVSSDVFEHVEPHLLEETIKQAADRASQFFFMEVPCSPTGKLFASGPYKGQDLHLTVEAPEWWKATVSRVLGGNWHLRLYTIKDHQRRGKRLQRVALTYEHF
jgi:hypothetical protein